MLKASLLGAVCLAAATVAGPAAADITIFVAGAAQGNPDENVLLNTQEVGTTIHGETNQTHTPINFTGLENLLSPPQGQARIEAVDGFFTYLDISPGAPWVGFTELELNIHADANGPVSLCFYDQFNTCWGGTYQLDGNGQNFYTGKATNGQYITHVTVGPIGNPPTQLEDVRQVRVTGINGVVRGVPEPATWAMLIFGFGMVGAGLRMRRRHEMMA